MSGNQKTVLVMHSDQLVLQGLVLLLDDLDLHVITVRNPENLDLGLTRCPDLILFPLETYTGTLGMSFVRVCRTFFNARIPAILVGNETGINALHSFDNKLIYCAAINQRIRLIQTIQDNLSVSADPDTTADNTGSEVTSDGTEVTSGAGSFQFIDIVLLMMFTSWLFIRRRSC